MLYGFGCGVFDNPSCLMTSAEMRFFWLLLSIIKCSGVPFTHICEWKMCSPSSISISSFGWIVVVMTIAVGSMSMICLFSIFFWIRFWIRVQLIVFDLVHQWLFQATFIGVVLGDFVEITPFFGVLLCLIVTLLFLCLGLVFRRLFVRDVFVILWLLWICRPELPFVLVLNLCSILTTYR